MVEGRLAALLLCFLPRFAPVPAVLLGGFKS